MFGAETFVSSSRVSCRSSPHLLTLRQSFGPLLHTDLLQIVQVLGLLLGNNDFLLGSDLGTG